MSEKIEIYWRLAREKVHKLSAYNDQHPFCFFAIFGVVFVIIIIVGFALYSPPPYEITIRIIVINECNYENPVNVWITVNGEEVYCGFLRLGTSSWTKQHSIFWDVPVGALIKIRVRSATFPMDHDAITPEFKVTLSPEITLHQDGSVTFKP